mmetsp:Transcript_32314/g.65739  ORF Transcript_32314/g.65739 Transcript_32314/m.65739 type:complete len:174 (+) Transcript_32314:193-714(+)
MPSLSNGALQKATRKAVVSLFNDNSTLRNQLFTDKALAIILSEACGVNIDTDTVSKAFAAGGESRYSLQFKDMSIGYEGESILFVYKVYKLPNDNYFTAVGWFDSVEAAEAVNVDIRRQVTGIAIENEVEEAFNSRSNSRRITRRRLRINQQISAHHRHHRRSHRQRNRQRQQ